MWSPAGEAQLQLAREFYLRNPSHPITVGAFATMDLAAACRTQRHASEVPRLWRTPDSVENLLRDRKKAD
jgi:hypothetical protein